jgi:hypothetical protein
VQSGVSRDGWNIRVKIPIVPTLDEDGIDGHVGNEVNRRSGRRVIDRQGDGEVARGVVLEAARHRLDLELVVVGGVQL